ncbi:MAG: hypothetical protein ACOC9N_02825 [Gemmatimonadota bacterium]
MSTRTVSDPGPLFTVNSAITGSQPDACSVQIATTALRDGSNVPLNSGGGASGGRK